MLQTDFILETRNTCFLSSIYKVVKRKQILLSCRKIIAYRLHYCEIDVKSRQYQPPGALQQCLRYGITK